MRVLIIGSGSIGNRHKKNLQQLGIHQFAWVSPQRKKSEEIPSATEKRFYSFEDSLSFKPNAVFVCNPTSLHFETAAFYLKNRIPVYLEKPISASLQEAELLEKIVSETKVFCMVGYQYRFHPTLKLAKNIIDRGDLGKILSIRSEVGEYLPDFHPEEDYRISYAARSELGGGVLLTLSHEIDYLCWMFGSMSEIQCTGGRKSNLEIDVEDFASLSMKNNSGILIQLNMDFIRKPPVRTLEVKGSDASLYWDYYGQLSIVEASGKRSLEASLPNLWERNQLFIDSLKCFLEGMNNSEPPKISISDGKNVAKIVHAAKESMRTLS
jgi:predicted dehydrogenase